MEPFRISPELLENDVVRLTEVNGELAVEHLPTETTLIVDETRSLSDLLSDELRSDLDGQGYDITNLGSVSTEEVGIGSWQWANSESDALDKLDAMADGSTVVFTAGVTFDSEDSITSTGRIIGSAGVATGDERDFDSGANITFTDRFTLQNVGIRGGADVTFETSGNLHSVYLDGDVVFEGNNSTAMGVWAISGGNITFASGTEDGEIGVISGNISVTDNGNNRIL